MIQADLFKPPPAPGEAAVTPWRPRALEHDQWPPDYLGVHAWRIKTLASLRANPEMLQEAHAYYKHKPEAFIQDWMDTYNPRKRRQKWMPFVFFKRQSAIVQFFEHLREHGENGLIEKCRDMGATWVACAYSVWALRYMPDDATGWGSRKQDLVDKLGDADSIFEKMRLMINRMPQEFRPSYSTALMKIINTQNGATITGESGDNIGRGGRKSRYFKDEAAHYERPEMIEAALGDNTDVQIDISSVNGLGNIFHRRRESGDVWEPDKEVAPGVVRVLVLDWRDHPEKTQAWYDQRKAKAEREGMQHIFAQEVDRNYSASVQNTIIDYNWITSSVDAHLALPHIFAGEAESGDWMAGLDLAEGESQDKNALAMRQSVILRECKDWGERDPGVVTRKFLAGLRAQGRRGIKVQYDSIGIGQAVRAEVNRLMDIGEITREEFTMVPWNAGFKVVRPFEKLIPGDDASIMNRDFFHNFRAQAWWSLRTRFYKTHKAVTEGVVYKPHELISIDGRIATLHQLMKELAQPTHGQSSQSLKMLVEKKPNGTSSPNLADSVVQCYFPAPEKGGDIQIGTYGV